MTITLTTKQVIYLYGFLEGALEKHEQVKDQLNNPNQTKETIISIMETIVEQLDEMDAHYHDISDIL